MDSQRHAVARAQVSVVGKLSAMETGVPGAYVFAERPGEEDVLLVSHPAFVAVTRSMGLYTNTNIVELVLQSPRQKRLSEVTVTGEGRTGGSRMASQEDLRRSSQLNWGDAARTLQALPGVVATGNSFDSRMYIQGGSDQEWVGMLDHVALFNPVRWNGAVSMLNPKVLESVGLSMAGYPAIYGQGLSGILVAKTLEPSRQGWHGFFGFDAGFEGLLTGPLGRHGGILISARRSWLDAVINLGKADPNFRFPFIADGLLKVQWRPEARTALEFLAYASSEGMDMPSGPGAPGRSVNETNGSTQFDYRDVNLILSVLFKQGFGAKSDLSLSCTALPRWNSNALSASTLQSFDNDNASLSWQAAGDLRLGDLAGNDFHLGALVVPYQADIKLRSAISYLSASGAWTNETRVVTNQTTDLYLRLFAQDAIQIHPRLVLTAGFGAAWLRHTGEWVWEPRGDLTWKPSEAWQLFARGGLYHAQEIDSVTLRRAPSAMASPAALHGSIGFQFAASGWLVSGEGFYKSYTGLLVPAPDQLLTNTGSRQVWGASAYLRRQRGKGEAMGGYLSYTFTRADEKVASRASGTAFEPLPEVGEVYTPSFIRAHSLAATLEVLPLFALRRAPETFRFLELLLEGRLQSGNPYTSVTNVMRFEIPGVGYRYQLLYGGYDREENPLMAGLDLKITFPIGSHVRTFFTVVNLLGSVKIIDTVYRVLDTPPAGGPIFYRTTLLGPGAVQSVVVKDQDGAVQFRGGVNVEF
ncbi:MAG: TonB-dependent receptor [Spirochaetes bacterium]|nr:TonB-dependent receptor [Spirochaetota bacterium]